MKAIYLLLCLLLLCLLPFQVISQTTHTVQVGGSTVGGTPPFYDPQHLTIEVGDIVQWTNTSGTHNVNGSLQHFPNNPEEFSSGSAQFGNWTFQHTFTLPGVYQYHCTQQGHSATQFGSITVENASSVQENTAWNSIMLFPSPTNDLLVIEVGAQDIRLAEVHGLDGRMIHSRTVKGQNRIEIVTNSMATGQYYLRLTDGSGRVITKAFRKE